MRLSALASFFVLQVLVTASCKQHNTFTFCRDFDPSGCLQPIDGVATFAESKTVRDKTIRDFANSIYFRGDRLAFAVQNARSKYDVTFECLHGRYTFADAPADKHEIEYIELRENNVYGLVMAGSLIEKKYAARRQEPYKPLPSFPVTYAVYCGKDLIAQKTITVEIK